MCDSGPQLVTSAAAGRRRPLLAGALAAALAAAVAPAAAAPYLFAEVAQTEAYPEAMDRFQAAAAGPALNEAGAVAFRRISGNVDGVYTRAPGGPVVPVATTAGDQFRAFGRAPDLNDVGAVVFHAFPAAGGEGLYLAAPGAPLVTVADTSAGTIRRFAGSGMGPGAPALPGLSNGGVVACVIDRPADTLNSAALLRYENGVAAVADEGWIIGSADVNDRGEAAYIVRVQGPFREQVRLADASGMRVAGEVQPAAGQSTLARAVASNDRGLIVSAYTYPFNVVLIRDGTVTVLTRPNTINFYGGFSVNDGGDVASTDPSGTTLYAGDPAAPHRVIGRGDELFGSTVERLAFSREGFNDAGQVAFWASLADGRNVIALATPVPEPAAAGLLLLAAAFPILLRRRRS